MPALRIFRGSSRKNSLEGVLVRHNDGCVSLSGVFQQLDVIIIQVTEKQRIKSAYGRYEANGQGREIGMSQNKVIIVEGGSSRSDGTGDFCCQGGRAGGSAGNIKTGSARRSCPPAMDALTFQTVCRSRSATAVVSRIFHGRRLGRLPFHYTGIF